MARRGNMGAGRRRIIFITAKCLVHIIQGRTRKA